MASFIYSLIVNRENRKNCRTKWNKSNRLVWSMFCTTFWYVNF